MNKNALVLDSLAAMQTVLPDFLAGRSVMC